MNKKTGFKYGIYNYNDFDLKYLYIKIAIHKAWNYVFLNFPYSQINRPRTESLSKKTFAYIILCACGKNTGKKQAFAREFYRWIHVYFSCRFDSNITYNASETIEQYYDRMKKVDLNPVYNKTEMLEHALAS
jgi:hypothetical protein